MRAFVSFILTVCFLIAGTEFRQVLRAPALVKHYLSHNTVQRELGLSAFLALHYCQNDDRDGDTQEDSSLPFKSSLAPSLIAEPYVAPAGLCVESLPCCSQLFLPPDDPSAKDGFVRPNEHPPKTSCDLA